MTKDENSLNSLFAQLLVLRILCDTCYGLPEQVRKGFLVLLKPRLDKLKALKSLFDDLRVLILSFKDERNENFKFYRQHDLA